MRARGAATSGPDRPGPPPAAGLILALLTTAGAAFILMQTLVLPALPHFGREFDVGPGTTAWIASAFLLSSSVMAPILGKLGDVHGKVPVLVVSLTVFTAASLAAAAAPSIEVLIGCRVLQGFGGAVLPLSFGIVRDVFPPHRVGFGIGTVSSVYGAGSALGLVASGVIIDALSWRWLFLLGAIPVAIGTVMIARYVPRDSGHANRRPDYLGAGLLAATVTTLLVGVNRWGVDGALTPAVLALLIASVLLAVVWWRVESVVAAPLIDPRTLRRPAIAATNLATVLVGLSLFSVYVLLPGFVQGPEPGTAGDFGFGASQAQVGLYFLPSSLAMLVVAPLAGWLSPRFGALLPLRAGLAIGAVGMALLAFFPDTPVLVATWMLLVGVGVATSFAAFGLLVVEHARADEVGVTAGINAIMRTVSAAIGAQLAASIVAASGVADRADGYRTAFAISALFAGAALLATLTLRRGAADR